jgi:hypothetical protein
MKNKTITQEKEKKNNTIVQEKEKKYKSKSFMKNNIKDI